MRSPLPLCCVVLVGLLAGCTAAGAAPHGPGAAPAATSVDQPPPTMVPPGTTVAPRALAGATATARRRAAAPPTRPAAVPRGPSTRVPPERVAAAVEPGRTVRLVVMRVKAGTARVDVVSRTGPAAVREAVAAAQADPSVVAVELDGRVHALDLPPVDDPLRSRQWALDALRAEEVWQVTQGAGQVVAVVDSGVDATHPDLAGRVLPGDDEVTLGGDGRTDLAGHGTHVAGIVAADAGNGIGVAGLAPQASVLPVRVLDADGSGNVAGVVSGVLWAIDHGATVINLSLGGDDDSDAMRSAMAYAVGRGVVVATAAGNERTSECNPVEYPAGYSTSLPGLMAVAATTSAGVSAAYSESGPQVTLSAPGSSIASTVPGGYASMSGTSMATPYVSAAAALVRSADPGLTPAQVSALLSATADDLEGPGRDDDTGAGLVDPLTALCRLGHCPPDVTASPTPSPSPSGAPAAPRLQVTLPASPAVSGRPAAVTVTATDAAGPVACAAVTLGSGNLSVHGVTGSTGTVRLVVTPARSAVWSVTATAPGHAVARATALLRVVPGVAVRWQASRVGVAVAPALGQTVTVWTRGSSGGWVRRSHVVTRGGTVTLPVPAARGAEVTVSAVTGLGGVTVVRR